MSRVVFKVTSTPAIRMGHKMESLWGGWRPLHGDDNCWGRRKHNAVVCGLNPQSPVVHCAANVTHEASQGVLYVPASDFPAYVDMLRNNPDIWVALDSQEPLTGMMMTNFAIA